MVKPMLEATEVQDSLALPHQRAAEGKGAAGTAPKEFLYSWKRWTKDYLPSKAEEEAASKIQESARLAQRWQEETVKLETRFAEAEAEISLNAEKVDEVQALAAQRARDLDKEHQFRVEELEALLAREREAHEEKMALLERQVLNERDRCDQWVKEHQARAAEQARRLKQEAEASIAEANEHILRAQGGVRALRVEEERLIHEARERADETCEKLNAEHRKEVERLQTWIRDRTDQMEETCAKYLDERLRAPQAAKGHVDAAEAKVMEQREAEKVELLELAQRFEEWRETMEARHDVGDQRAQEIARERAEEFWGKQASMRLEQQRLWALEQAVATVA